MLHKPIKRSIALSPLSRDHHEGLLFVWKIRQGVKKNIATERIIKFCFLFWESHLQFHFEKEETVLPQVLSNSHSLMQQMFREHEIIKIQFEELDQKKNYESLELLAQTINDHIRFEERQLFNEIEKNATVGQLHQIEKQLKDEKKNAVWDDEF